MKESFRVNDDLEIDRIELWVDYVYYKARTNKNKRIICRNGGFVPTIKALLPSKKQELTWKVKKEFWAGSKPVNNIKRKRLFRNAFLKAYYE